MKKKDMATVVISKFNPFLLCVQKYMGFSYSSSRAHNSNSYKADRTKDSKDLKPYILASYIQLINLGQIGTEITK